MSRSPLSNAGNRRPDRYLDSWERLARMIQHGKSFSGRERNSCFLNVKDGTFADVSSAVGLDHLDDGRALAVVDWDGDGDLDIWLANRTGPRIRLMKNNLAENNRFVAIRLEGDPAQGCPRDAVGARVRVQLAGPQPRSISKTLYAGDSFLSQSSKWLYFGLGHDQPSNSTRVLSVSVRWPGSDRPELFDEVRINHRYLLKQGTGTARRLASRDRLAALPASKPAAPNDTATVRLRLSKPVAIRELEYMDNQKTTHVVEVGDGVPVLIMFWATWCHPCIEELRQLSQSNEIIQKTGLRILALNVDGLKDPTFNPLRAEQMLSDMQFPFDSAVATDNSVTVLTEALHAAIHPRRPLPIPCSFLINASGRVSVIYKGAIPLETLDEDIQFSKLDQSLAKRRALPFNGRWYATAFRGDPISVARIYLEGAYYNEARRLMEEHLAKEPGPPNPTTDAASQARNRRIADVHRTLGAIAAAQKQFGAAAVSLRNALRFRQDSQPVKRQLAAVLTELGMRLKSNGRVSDAVERYHEALRAVPGWPPAANNLAWTLATTDDATLRDGEKAVRLARDVCELSDFQDPRALDTLSAALAETGDFDRAIQVGQRAWQRAQNGEDADLAEEISVRLEFYKKGEPFREPAAIP